MQPMASASPPHLPAPHRSPALASPRLLQVHQAVIASGARFSGPTVHFIDEEYDTGPILAQAVVPVYPTDSPQQLAARVLREEHQLLPRCVAALCEDRLTWRHDGIPIMWSAH